MTGKPPENLPHIRILSIPKLRAYLDRQKDECTWCGGKLPGRRRTWCCRQCKLDYMLTYCPTTVRTMTWKRDRGVCAICGMDCGAMQKYLNRWSRKRLRDKGRVCFKPRGDGAWRLFNKRGRKNRHKRDRYIAVIKERKRRKIALWEADHIQPVLYGGMVLGMENIRTLCFECHKNESRALAAERAMVRKTKGGKRGKSNPHESDTSALS